MNGYLILLTILSLIILGSIVYYLLDLGSNKDPYSKMPSLGNRKFQVVRFIDDEDGWGIVDTEEPNRHIQLGYFDEMMELCENMNINFYTNLK